MTDSAVSPVTAASPVPAAVPAYRRKLYWVALLYFSEGLPLGVFYDIFPVYFRQQGVDLASIGLLSLLGLAWTLKFLWAPLVDWARRHRGWIAGANLGMAGVMAAFAYGHATALGLAPWVWAAIGAFTVLSATNDIATDGYTIELLDPREYGLANGLRIGFYRVGMLFAGVVLMLSGWVGWTGAYLPAARCSWSSPAVVLFAPPERAPALGRLARRRMDSCCARSRCGCCPRAGRRRAALAGAGAAGARLRLAVHRRRRRRLVVEGRAAGRPDVRRRGLMVRAARGPEADGMREGPVFGAWVELLARPGMIGILLFILLFKLGDAAMGFMVKPFWVDAGFSAQQIGLVSVNVGLALSIAGGLVGGWYVDRAGIYRGCGCWASGRRCRTWATRWPRTLCRRSGRGGAVGRAQAAVYGASALESFTGGLGTGAFLAFLMAITSRSAQPPNSHPVVHLRVLARRGGLGRGLQRGADGLRALLFSHLFAKSFRRICCCPGPANARRGCRR